MGMSELKRKYIIQVAGIEDIINELEYERHKLRKIGDDLLDEIGFDRYVKFIEDPSVDSPKINNR